MTNSSTDLAPDSAPEDDVASALTGPTALGAWWAKAFVVYAVLASLVYLWSVSVPGARFNWWAMSVIVLLGMAATWLLALLVTVWRVATGRRRRPGWHLLLVPLIGIVTISLSWTDVPLRLRFEPARPDFDVFAERVLAEAATVPAPAIDEVDQEHPDGPLFWPSTPDSIGGIAVRETHVYPDSVFIYDQVGGFFDPAGYAYLPSGRLPDGRSVESAGLSSLGGEWYAFIGEW